MRALLVAIVAFATLLSTSGTTSAAGTAILDFSQCANDPLPSVALDCPGGWINGNLTATKAHYAEDQVVPQRALLNLSGAGIHTINVTYEARKGGKHAFDSLGTYNTTQSALTATTACAGLTCSPTTPVTTFPIPPDPTVVHDSGPGPYSATSGHQLPGQVMTLVGGTITNVSVPTHNNALAGSGDDTATVTVTFTTTGAASALLLFGGHVAPALGTRGWGSGLSATSITGSPYHIGLNGLDGASTGSKDNQMQSAVVVAQTSITTTQGQISANVGATLSDSATLANGSSPTGSITFRLYAPSDATCAGTPFWTSSAVNVNGNGTYQSGASTATNAAGVWHWTATYTPASNTNNLGSSSGCADEPVTVLATPTLTTIPAAAPLGSALSDSGTLAGGSNPSGTITFRLYSPTDPSCTTAVYTSTVSVSGNATYNSSSGTASGSNTATAVGTWQWTASYSGDTFNQPAASGCGAEVVTVDQTSTSLSTTPDPTTATVGAALADSATLSGGYGTLGGTITFSLYAPSAPTCTGAPFYTNTVPVSGTGVYGSGTSGTTDAAGTWRWTASYSGDANNVGSSSGCNAEQVTVGKASTSITTTPGAGGTVGVTLSDSATISGGFGTPTGNVTFNLYGPGDATCEGLPFFTSTVASSGGTASSGASGTTNAAGTWRWTASYAGDDNNSSSVSGCGAETVIVDRASPTLTTTPGAGGTVGVTLSDSATIGGGFNPTGNVTFNLYGPGDATCEGLPFFTSTVASSGGTASSGASGTTNAAGTWRWTASYAGDDNNNGASSGCQAEQVTVDKASLTLSTTLVGTTDGHAALGSTVSDTATVGGYNTNITTAVPIAFNWYAKDVPCIDGTPGGTASGTAAVANGTVGPSSLQSSLAAGTYNFQASFAGDSNYNAITSACEPITIDKAQLSITTVIAGGDSQGLGSTPHDNATVTGGVSGFPLPAVSFTFGAANEACTGNSIANGTTDGNATASSVNTDPLGAGSYNFRASVAENANYLGAPSACEPLTVSKAKLSLATLIKDPNNATVTAIEVGGTVHDTATLSGANPNFSTATNATITFTFATNGSCTGGTPETAVAVANDAASGANHGALTAGNYSFLASYSGNANYEAIANGACVETLAVVDANISITPGQAINDVGVPHTFNVTANAIPSGTSTTFNSITVTILGANIISNSCSPFTGTVSGDTRTCAVSISGAVPAQTVYTANASLSVTMGGVSVTRATGDGKLGDSGSANKEYDCLTHQFTMKFGPAGKSATSYANLNGGLWLVEFRYRYSTDNGASYSGWTIVPATLLNPNAPEVDGLGSLNYAATVTIPTPNTPYGALVQWQAAVYSGGNSATPDIVPFSGGTGTLGSKSLPNSGDCAGSDSTVSPVTDVTVFKGIGATSTFDVLLNPLSGWTITATSGTTSFTTTTGADGSAQLQNLDELVQWTICETQQNGWAQSFPPASDTGLNTDSGRCYLRAPRTFLTGPDYVFGNKKNLGLSTQIVQGNTPVGGQVHVALGSVVHDTATVSGQFGNIAPAGTISFKWFTNTTCNGDGTPVALAQNSTNSTIDSAPLAVGTGYSYLATIADDANYVGATAACEPLTVDQAPLAISTVVYNGQVALANPGALAAGATPIVNDTATATGQIGAIAPTGAITFQFFTNGTCASTPAATPAATQNGLTASSANSASLAAGTYSYLAAIAGDTNYTGATAACETFTVTTLTITKQVIPTGGPTFTFAVAGASTLNVNVATAGTPGTGSTTVVINAGSNAVTEGAVQSYLLTAFNCGGLPVIGTVNFSATAGTNTNCFAENTKVQVATRTQGFWATHTTFTDAYWTSMVPTSAKNIATWGPASCLNATVRGNILSTETVNANEVMGGFWSNITNKAGGGKRTDIDKARMQLLQQIFASILNKYVLQVDDGGKLATAMDKYCGGSINDITAQTNVLSQWNASGDTAPLPNNYLPGNATPSLSRKWADTGYWDITK